MRLNNTIVTISTLIILFPLGYSVVSSVFSQDIHGPQSFIEKPDAKYDSCFSGTTPPEEILERFDTNKDGELDDEEETFLSESLYMRFHHMDVLKKIRDETMREGSRSDIGLNNCTNTCGKCHTSRARFCDRCHDAVNLHPNCFHCHYYPE